MSEATGRDLTHLNSFLAAGLLNSWFSMRDSTKMVKTRSGTPAGSALGDALFVLAFAGVMADLTNRLRGKI